MGHRSDENYNRRREERKRERERSARLLGVLFAVDDGDEFF